MKFKENNMKSTKVLLTTALMALIAGPISAQEKMITFIELKRAGNLCLDFVSTGEDELNSLASHGYKISKKRKKTSYKKGVGFHLFGAAGIDVFKYSSGCTINGRGISQTKGNQVYKELQNNLVSAGYKRGGKYFKKGGNIISISGSYVQGSTAVISIYKEN